jgi:hypothetical protein
VTNFDRLAALVPPGLFPLSGAVFYSGRDAFENPSPVYLIGLNPGGDPEALAHATVEEHLRRTAEGPGRYSAYRDEVWSDQHAEGQAPYQRRVLHLCHQLGIDPADLPASNLVFARSRREATMPPDWEDRCWPVHAAVIDQLGVRVVIALGGTAGSHARQRLRAHREVARFVEDNARRWTSYVHEAPSGIRVATLTHPSVADWINRATDPTGLVRQALELPLGAGSSAPVPQPQPCLTDGCSQQWLAHAGPCD